MRRPDWERRLQAYLGSHAATPHAFGKHDCMIFVAGAVKAMTGHDPARGHRGKYGSAAAATRYLKGLGFDSPADMVAATLEEKPVARAGRGDIVIDGEGIPGVCIGGEAVFVGSKEGEEGLVRLPRREWVKAFAV